MNGALQQIRFATNRPGGRIAFATSGHGTPLIKTSNWLNHLQFDWGSPVWRHWLKELSGRHTLIRYDELGCGLSDWNVNDLSFETLFEDLETVVQAAGHERFALLGISQGAATAVSYAAKYPERVTHLIIHGGYVRGRLKRGPTPADLERVNLLLKLVELGWDGSNVAFRQFFTTQFIPGATLEQQQWFNELARVSTSTRNALDLLRVVHGIDAQDQLPHVQCPALVLHPRGDQVVPFDEGRLIAAGIPRARFVPLESNNHLLLEDEPAWGRFLDELRAFLPEREADASLASLTARERDLLELIAQGRDNTQIAATLTLSAKTVRNHITSIFAKLEVENRAQAIVLAREAGFGGQAGK